jgi:Glycine-zipper domain
MRKTLLAAAFATGFATYAGAQVATQAAPAGPAPTLGQIGMIIYPSNGQTPEQQKADEAACTQWAESQTGLKLQAGSVDTEAAAQAAQQQAAEATQGAAVAGAARGAAGGAIIGAIAGDAGEGAAIGAVAGAVGGRRAKRRAEAQAAQAGAQQAQAQNQQAIDTFKKAAGVCLQGRGYAVS